MSLREEDKQKTSCSSRGLGLAAAAIGVGIGAALYYIFSKEEAPDTEGATSAQWTTESPQTFHEDHNSSNDYTTVSENTTTDTSMYDDSHNSTISDNEDNTTQDSDSSSSIINISSSSIIDISSSSSSDDTLSSSSRSDSHNDSDWSTNELDRNEWDVDTSLELPQYYPPSSTPVFDWFNTLVSARSERNRERTWSLEECSICFEVILKNQEVMTLSCTHNFHQSCILPWLQEQQTCPNCRKAVN